MRVLVALGGNAMVGRDGRRDVVGQREAIALAMRGIADLVDAGTDVVLTHGNGPQVGDLLTQSESASETVPPLPLDLCVAATQGTIGVLLLNALEYELRQRGLTRQVAVLAARVQVDAADPGFTDPTKPVGRWVDEAEAAGHQARGEIWRRLGERGWRRMVASPEPLRVLEADAVRALLEAGFLVVAEGGGGVPVIELEGSGFGGVHAVVDKDLTACLLARAVGADVLCIATDVSHVMTGYGRPEQQALTRVDVPTLRKLAGEGQFAAGSMGPKVEAAARFVEAGGSRAVIGALTGIRAAVINGTGTVVVP